VRRGKYMLDEASQRRVVVKAGAATAHASAGGVAVVIEGLRDVYELHWAFLIVAALLGVSMFFAEGSPKYEGHYFEVRTTAGDPVFIHSGAFRSGVGRVWFAPSVADAISIEHFSGRR
jgi:hypothetical protein